jgi:UDP-N-acetylglucosamine--N-acetylmuramyl-(pentapeptide) pyrophosphoryl-undecaprenol N-acetylglucosamine transferase
MEARLVPQHGIPMEGVRFGGLRGKGLAAKLLLPLALLRAFAQSVGVLRRVRPDVVLGLGGYITFPAGMMSALLGKPLVLHEQNSVAGLANRVLAQVPTGCWSPFPTRCRRPSGAATRCAPSWRRCPSPRAHGRTRGPLSLLVVGGSLGAQALNETVPRALALLPAERRPRVVHQSGRAHLEALRAAYAAPASRRRRSTSSTTWPRPTRARTWWSAAPAR